MPRQAARMVLLTVFFFFFFFSKGKEAIDYRVDYPVFHMHKVRYEMSCMVPQITPVRFAEVNSDWRLLLKDCQQCLSNQERPG